MKRTPRTTTVKARALTDPRPAFVSMVKGGANQRPFRAVKADLTEVPPENQEENTMAKKSYTAPEGHDIAALNFSSAEFQTEASVKDWLENGGYTDYTIEATKSGFEVTNTAVDFVTGTTERVEGAVKGLTVYVGKVAGEAPAEKSEEEETQAKTADNTSAVQPVATAVKSRLSAAQAKKATEAAEAAEAVDADVDVSETDTPDEAAKSEEAPAEAEVEAPAEAVADVAVEETASKGMHEIEMMGDILWALKWMTEDAEWNGIAEADVAAIKKGAKQLLTALGGMQTDVMSNFAEAFKTAKTQATADEAPAEKEIDAAGDTVKGDEQSEEVTEKSEAPANDVMVAIKALTDAVTALTGEVAATKEGLGEVVKDVEKTKSDLAEREEADKATTQSRKGADVSGDTTAPQHSAEELKTRSDQAARRLRSTLGSQFASDTTYRA